MSLSEQQRLYILAGIPSQIAGDTILVFEDDGGGWHHDLSIENWISYKAIGGPRWAFTVLSRIRVDWNPVSEYYEDERGQINKGTLYLYLCSTDKRKIQRWERELVEDIERHRLGLSLDYEGVTTGPETATGKPVESYSDLRLKKRVYRIIIEVPILYLLSKVLEIPPIKIISFEPRQGWPLAAAGTLYLKAPFLLRADILLGESTALTLAASIILSE